VTSTEFEERLREEMRHATTGVSVPSGLVRRARRARRRRIVLRVGAASAAAAVAVAGAVIVSNGATGASRVSGAYTTAYVVKHVKSALDAVNEIAYVHFTPSPGMAALDLWVRDGPRGLAYRAEYFDSVDGQVFLEVGITATPANYETWINVNPLRNTWTEQSYQGPKPRGTGCGTPLPTSLDSFPEIAAGLREYLACGTLSYEGQQHVDGVDALKLVSVEHQRQGKTLTTLTTTIWVDPATYLPVRVTYQTRFTTRGTRPMVSVPTRFDIRWLPPTSANLALLTVRIPAGFTRVPIPCQAGCLVASRLAGHPARQGRGGRAQAQVRAVAVLAPNRDYARGHQVQAVDEAQDLRQRVDVCPRGGVLGGEVLPLRALLTGSGVLDASQTPAMPFG
jgi:hypothetical protein